MKFKKPAPRKKTKFKDPVKVKKKQLVKKLDDLTREYIKNRDNHTCQRCGSNNNKMDWAHVFTRELWAIRWDEDNSLCLCAGCHMYFHKEPFEFKDFIIKFLGLSKWQNLLLKKRNYFQRSVSNLELKLIQLERNYKS